MGIGTHLANPTSLLKGQLLRLPDEHPLVDVDILGIAAAIQQAKHLIANLPLALGLILAQLRDDAAKLEPHDLTQVRDAWVLSLSLQDVTAVDAERLDADEHLARLYHGHWGGVVDEEGRRGATAVFGKVSGGLSWARDDGESGCRGSPDRETGRGCDLQLA